MQFLRRGEKELNVRDKHLLFLFGPLIPSSSLLACPALPHATQGTSGRNRNLILQVVIAIDDFKDKLSKEV